ncbi:hypothetical protein V8E36_009951 [Tilletia maclaganii]
MDAEPTAPVAGPAGGGTPNSSAKRQHDIQRCKPSGNRPGPGSRFSVTGVIPQLDIYAKLDADDLRELIHKKDKHIDQLVAAILAQGKKIDKLTKAVETLSARQPDFPPLGAAPNPFAPPQTRTTPPTASRTMASVAADAANMSVRNLAAEREACRKRITPESSHARRATPRQLPHTPPFMSSFGAFMGVRVSCVHNIAFPTPYMAELTYVKSEQEELVASIRTAGLTPRFDFDPSRPAQANASQELKERVQNQFTQRLCKEVASAALRGDIGLADHFKAILAEHEKSHPAQPTTAAGTSAQRVPAQTTSTTGANALVSTQTASSPASGSSPAQGATKSTSNSDPPAGLTASASTVDQGDDAEMAMETEASTGSSESTPSA